MSCCLLESIDFFFFPINSRRRVSSLYQSLPNDDAVSTIAKEKKYGMNEG
jgi:hypothetical protein